MLRARRVVRVPAEALLVAASCASSLTCPPRVRAGRRRGERRQAAPARAAPRRERGRQRPDGRARRRRLTGGPCECSMLIFPLSTRTYSSKAGDCQSSAQPPPAFTCAKEMSDGHGLHEALPKYSAIVTSLVLTTVFGAVTTRGIGSKCFD